MNRTVATLLLLVAPALAFAQEVVTPVPTPVPTGAQGWVSLLLQYLLVPLIGLLIAAINNLRKKWAGEGTKNAYELWLSRILNALDPLGSKLLARLEPKMQVVMADGIVTQEERALLTQEALVAIREYLGEDGIKEACAALGIPDPMGLASWVVTKLLERMLASKAGMALPLSHRITEPPASVLTSGAGMSDPEINARREQGG